MKKGKVAKKLTALAAGFALATTCLIPQSLAFAAENTVGASAAEEYQARFMDLWQDIHDPANGYFSPEGVPYHSIETLIVEAPDYGHETTSEAMSYYIWLEAMYGKFTKDWTKYTKAWDVVEKSIIPTSMDQPGMGKYTANKPATYAGEWEEPSGYPSPLETNVPVGSDPIHSELYSAYGTYDIYGMHWIMDVDNWYGYGNRGDGTSKPSYINTFQRGEQESCWETVTHPSWEAFKWGGTYGFADLFVKDAQPPAKQWRYTDAPDADARAVQASYWAKEWAKESGADVKKYTEKAAKMGDYLRYAFFDKYFKKIGAQDKNATGSGYDSAHYLISWYYAWGGGLQGDWAWKIGSSHNHGGYQNPMAAWALANDPDLKPRSTNGASDWKKSLDRQIEFYTWLQSAEGAIAGGATNSYKGRYEKYPAGTSTFYGMAYDWQPVYHDPPSNEWFGFQCWSMQRVAEYYFVTGDKNAEKLLDKWSKWAISGVKLPADGSFQIISNMDWTGQPDTWSGYASHTGNPNLKCTIRSYGTDLGVAGSFANTLLYYAAATKKWSTYNDEPRRVAKELLDRMWTKYRDDKGIAAPETRGDFKRFFTAEPYIPAGWTGKMANGDAIKSGVKFIDIRTKYKQDPGYKTLETAYAAGKDPTFTYHRFWGQADIALALGTYSILSTYFPDVPVGGTITGTVQSNVTSTSATINAGFTAKAGTLSATTDSTGKFEIKGVPAGATTLTISKKNYLTRTIANVNAGDVVNTTLFFGDIVVDGAINMSDIMAVANAFNSVKGDSRYDVDLDANQDGAINMADIMGVANRFNATAASYN